MAKQVAKEIGSGAFRGRVLCVAFVDRKSARELNRKFRRRDYATDVLSFEPLEPGDLGELVICPEVISKQSREHGLLVREELGYMVLHGFLHLLGYDHEKNAREEKRMFELQDRVFAELLKAPRPKGPRRGRS